MNAVLIAFFVSTGAGGIDAPDAPVRTLAGKASQIEAVVDAEEIAPASTLQRDAIHDRGEQEPAFKPAPSPIV